jgi:hypothetical protein
MDSLLLLVGSVTGLLRFAAWGAGLIVGARLRGAAPRAAVWMFVGSGLGLFCAAASVIQSGILPFLGMSLGNDELTAVYSVVFLLLGVAEAASVGCVMVAAAVAGGAGRAPSA